MEIRPILSAMWRNRTGSVLIAIQIALTLAIVVNSLFLAKDRLEFIGRDSGIDVDNIVLVRSTGFGSNYQHDESITADLEFLRQIPGVKAVTPASHVPMSGSGNGSGFRASMDEDAPSTSANVFNFDEHAVEALGINMIEGSGFKATEIRRSDDDTINVMPNNVIITKALADELFPGESALGKRVFSNLGNSSEVTGVIEVMHGSWVHWDGFTKVMWMPQRVPGVSVQYIIRAEPGQRNRIMPIIEKGLIDLNRNRIIRNVRTMSESTAESYELDNAMAFVLSLTVFLLLIVTGLGIVGLASFSVQQRTRQIGTRRAIGARKRDIIRYFLLENWLMTTIGIILGTILTIAINYTLSSLFDLNRLNYFYLPMGMAMLWLLGFLAVSHPSWKASKISPAIATRNV